MIIRLTGFNLHLMKPSKPDKAVHGCGILGAIKTVVTARPLRI